MTSDIKTNEVGVLIIDKNNKIKKEIRKALVDKKSIYLVCRNNNKVVNTSKKV